MALTDAQRAEIRMFLGWTPRYGQTDNALERAMNAIETFPADESLITNAIGDDPPGLLASIKDVDSKLIVAHGRLKADNVGSIQLNRREMSQLYRDGKRMVGRLARLLGVEVRGGPFSSGRGGRASAYGPAARNAILQG